MGSVGQQASITIGDLSKAKTKSFVGLFKHVLNQNNIPILETKKVSGGKIIGGKITEVTQQGVAISKTNGAKTPSGKVESVFISISGNGKDYIKKKDAEKIRDAILKSNEYLTYKATHGIKQTVVYF